MELTNREKAIIKLISFKMELESAKNQKFISDNQYNEFLINLSNDEKFIIDMFNKERENADLINLTLQTFLNE